MSKLKQCGFTLIELLIVVAIAGIIAATAVPMYRDYAKKSMVAEALVISEEARAAMIAYHIKHRKFVKNYRDASLRNIEIGLRAMDEYKSDSVRKMWVGNKGVRGKNGTSGAIVVLLDPSLGVGQPGTSSRLISTIEYKDGEYIYVCNDTDGFWGSDIKYEYLPKSCHN